MNALHAVLLIAFASPLLAHPAFQHHFNNIVNSNPCLKKCMDQATESGQELSFLKTANVSGFLLDLDNICSMITTARECISHCGVNSNPFALESMTTICSEESKEEVKTISECLEEQAEPILEKCVEECGDYDELNDEVHRLTQAFKPEQNKQEEVGRVMTKINEACASLKCSDRCSVKELSKRCERVEGKDVGTVVQELIQKVLQAQRRDLERMRLVDTLAHSTPPQCSYMYMPEVMFDENKDQAAHQIVTNQAPLIKDMQRTQASNDDKKSDLSLALSQIQTHLLKKQMQILEIQERNLMRESQKLDLEMELLARKRLRMNSMGMPYGFFRQL